MHCRGARFDRAVYRGALWILASASGAPLVKPDVSIDDAPEGAAMMVLFVSPVFLVRQPRPRLYRLVVPATPDRPWTVGPPPNKALQLTARHPVSGERVGQTPVRTPPRWSLGDATMLSHQRIFLPENMVPELMKQKPKP